MQKNKETNREPLLVMRDIKKYFPGVKALDGASLTVMPGSVHALMGENGAGKSTLMKCLFGVYRKDGGEIIFEGKEVEFGSPKEALLSGVAMVHQELNQALKLSVCDNMWLGRFPKKIKNLPFIDEQKMKKMTTEVYKSLGIEIDPDMKMSKLSVSERQMAEIAKAVSYGARIIVFDEPTSSLGEGECERLFRIIEELKSAGCGIVYISHKMAEIARICDTVTVMRDGKFIASAQTSELSTDKIISLMVGRELGERYPKREAKIGSTLFEARGLVGKDERLKDVSLTLKAGEVLGIAGLDGAGRTELVEAIFGLSGLESGELYLDGERVYNRSPAEALKNGFALLTEERRKNGIFGILDIRENTTVASLRRFRSLFFINDKKRSEATRRCIKATRVRCPSEHVKISSLSGGNQQKVIFGRLLLTEPRVLLLDEPTRGVDVGAKYEIYTLINKLAEEGRGVIAVSSEMPELIGISDRIAVMSAGRLAGILSREEFDQERIMALAGKYV